MLAPKLPGNQKALVARPEPVKVVVAEDSSHPLTFVLPPLDDLAEMEELGAQNFSIEEISSNHVAENKKSFEREFAHLQVKAKKFSESPVFLGKLASLAKFAGYLEKEKELSKRALELDGGEFYAHRLGDTMIVGGHFDEAEQFFKSLDLSMDIGANLRMAAFCMHRQDIEGAVRFVGKAVEIDPLDFNTRLFGGGLQLIQKRYAAAVQSFRTALEERPTSSAAHCNLAIAYVGLRHDDKALSSLKRSVALDPLNLNSVMLLADLSFRLKKDEDAIPALRCFIQDVQTNAAVWSRLARACYRIGKFEEAIAALKREGSISDSGAVWNNLGVSYFDLGNKKRALESFTHAMRLEEQTASRTYFLAARNIAHLFATNEMHSEIRALVRPLLRQDENGLIFSDDEVSDLLAFYVGSLLKDRHVDEAKLIAAEVLSREGVSDSLTIWLVSSLVGYAALHGNSEPVIELARAYDRLAANLSEPHRERRERYFNNVAFAVAELGRVSEAEAYLSEISSCIHRSAYPTATFGLIQFRKGNATRGKALYEEAVKLASSKNDKARIRQKLNLELGRHWLELKQQSKAKRILDRAINENLGEVELSKQARTLIDKMRRLP